MLANVILNRTGGTIESKYFPGKGWKPVKSDDNIMRIRGYDVPVNRILDEDSARFVAEIGDYIRNYKIGPTIGKQVSEGYNVVITHGTDTLVKTAGVVNHNLFGNKRRVVFTGALYPPEFANFDGDENRGDAVVFAVEGTDYSGTFIVMGGKVLYPDVWSKHYYILHNPLLEQLRQKELKGIFKSLDFELHEPIDNIADIKRNKVFPAEPRKLKYDDTTYLKVDGYFSVTNGGDGIVRHLDFRGDLPGAGKIAEINDFLNEYSKLKGITLNYPENRNDAISDVENLFRKLRIDKSISDTFMTFWKEEKLKPHFDPRTNLEEVLITDTTSNPLGYKSAIKDEIWKAIVISGPGYGNVYVTPKWEELLRVAESRNTPIIIVTEEGIVTSKEYEVSRQIYSKHNATHSGTLNAEEARIRAATVIGHKDKKKLIDEVADIFRTKPLTVFSSAYAAGLLWKDPEQRTDWEKIYRYSTNPDMIVSPLFIYEEKIMLSALNHAYVSGEIKRYKIKMEEEKIVLHEERPTLIEWFKQRFPLG